MPNVTWIVNGTEVDFTNPSITITNNITNTATGVNQSTTLTWVNVPVGARGRYDCIINNTLGSDQGTYDVYVSSKFICVMGHFFDCNLISIFCMPNQSRLVPNQKMIYISV